MTDNPYQSPGVVAEDEPPSDLLRQQEIRTMEWFLRANDSAVLMLFALAVMLAASAVFLFFGEDDPTHWRPLGGAIAAIFAAALAWFQWRYHIAAIVLSGALSLLILLMIVIFVVAVALPHVIGRTRPMPPTDMASELFALLFGFAAIAVWIYAVSLPLQVAMRAWTWHRQGIDLSEIRAEIRRRA